jgi:hypothetical protein
MLFPELIEIVARKDKVIDLINAPAHDKDGFVHIALLPYPEQRPEPVKDRLARRRDT